MMALMTELKCVETCGGKMFVQSFSKIGQLVAIMLMSVLNYSIDYPSHMTNELQICTFCVVPREETGPSPHLATFSLLTTAYDLCGCRGLSDLLPTDLLTRDTSCPLQIVTDP